MAGNIQADNSGNILVEFDYNNIIVVDPNKTIDDFGNVNERLVDHEKLVMYANLEADVLPRTKMAVGASANSTGIQTISVAKINFLKPTKNTYLDTGYYDTLTGQDSTKKAGTNQPLQIAQKQMNGQQPYFQNTVQNQNDVIDQGLLGITQISMTTNTSFVPNVKIELEDVQGRALFQLGEDSPYSAFFNLPYPQFYLTLKGYYGQAIRYQLQLKDFNCRFNSFSGNYQISLQFFGYKFNIMGEISMAHLLALPHMYPDTVELKNIPAQLQQSGKQQDSQTQGTLAKEASNSQTGVAKQIVTERGYQKIREVYAEYKSKGLIPPDFPELTVAQLMDKLENFEKNILNSFPPVKLEPLTNIREYKKQLTTYFNAVRGDLPSSWFIKYCDTKPIVLSNDNRYYVFKRGLKEEEKINARSELQAIITENNGMLARNPTLGTSGTNPLRNPITYKMISKSVDLKSIDWYKTTSAQTAIPLEKLTPQQVEKIRITYPTLLAGEPKIEEDEETGALQIELKPPDFFTFEFNTQVGTFNVQIPILGQRFDDAINLLKANAQNQLSSYEALITAELAKKIEDTETGIGFRPSVRNMVAVIMASTDAFVRLMDDVHVNAWSQRTNPIRKDVILNNPSSAKSSDSYDYVAIAPNSYITREQLKNAEIPVYPWPQFFVETNEDKKGRFQLKYLGDPSLVQYTRGNLYTVWPEVEFVEEYLRGINQKFNPPLAPEILKNQNDTNEVNINAIEFPQSDIAYITKEEIRFLYEIWERQFITSHYSGYNRAMNNQFEELIKLNTEVEVNNIVTQIALNAVLLSFTLKNYKLTSANFEDNLENVSNAGKGKSWQTFIRDIYVTPYLRVDTENPFSILSLENIGKNPLNNPKVEALEQLIKNVPNAPKIVDTYPFTDYTWDLGNLANSSISKDDLVFKASSTLKVFKERNIISNFSDLNDFITNRPVTNFGYLLSQKNPTPQSSFVISQFYQTRLAEPNKFLATEGVITSTPPSGSPIPFSSTTSMLNTPFFVNAIQEGTNNQRSNERYPYVAAAYLFLNSLPLASLRERYKTATDSSFNELDYIASCFNKFGAIHKVPYAWILKLGSIWHRYKTYKTNGRDIIGNVWKGFDYKKNYYPPTSDLSHIYNFKYNNLNVSITGQTIGQQTLTQQVGFYPQLISDYCYFVNGVDLYSGYTNEEIQTSINAGVRIHNYSTSNINGAITDGKFYTEKTWSVIIPEANLFLEPNVCDPNNNSSAPVYYICPSFGSNVNQVVEECLSFPPSGLITIPTTRTQMADNQNIFNGSVRCLWGAPNYGYFDVSQAVIPPTDAYLNLINTGSTQFSFSIFEKDYYSKIEEVFSVFEKSQLDTMETQFLDFCRAETNQSVQAEFAKSDQSTGGIYTQYRNFQTLFKNIMQVDAQLTNKEQSQYFNDLFDNQLLSFENTVKNFLEYDVIIRNGNPTKYRRRIFYSFISYQNNVPEVEDPLPFAPYVGGSLPSANGTTTLAQSKARYPREWRTLESEVGFSTIERLRYSDLGSYITDFFIDCNLEFSTLNIETLAPLIKMYATQKLKNSQYDLSSFQNDLNTYFIEQEVFQNLLLDSLLTTLNNVLPDSQIQSERTTLSVIQGEQSKVQLYEIFKSLNDKWISGADWKEKTLFEDILFLDRASRDIGDIVLIDIFSLKNTFNKDSINAAMSVYTFVTSMMINNNFVCMNLPAYVNFYNVQEVSNQIQTPKSEGSLEFANSLWGTFLDVDYRKSSPKLICFFVPRPSEYVNTPKFSRFRSDAFDMGRFTDNPLIENQKNKTDWARSNRCVGFNVDIGIRNQNIFYSFSVSQDAGKATAEALNTVVQMANQAGGKNYATQNVSLYNMYLNRSYACQVVCLGNALLQPMMYFNLRHVPMFNGPYLIQEVQHAITPGNFQTTFTGTRQGIYDLPSIDNYLQSVNQNLLTKLEQIVKTNKEDTPTKKTTEQQKQSSLVNSSKNSKAPSNSCVAKVNPVYLPPQQVSAASWVEKTDITGTSKTPQEFADILLSKVPNFASVRAAIYSICYLRTYNKKSKKFESWGNNFATVTLEDDFPSASKYFSKTYSCVNLSLANGSTNTSSPIVHFETFEKFIDFMVAKLINQEERILEGMTKFYVCFWPKNNVSPIYFSQNPNEFKSYDATFDAALKSAQNVKIVTVSQAQQASSTNKQSTPSPSGTPTVTRTPSVSTPFGPLANVCDPPGITNFSPVVGNSNSVITVNGRNLQSILYVEVLGVKILPKDLTVLPDGKQFKFTLPSPNNPSNPISTIQVSTSNGFVNSTGQIKFDVNANSGSAAAPPPTQLPLPSPTPPASSDKSMIAYAYSVSKSFLNFQTYKDGKLKGRWFESEGPLQQNHNATLYLLNKNGVKAKVADFVINNASGTPPNAGDFVSSVDRWEQALSSLAESDKQLVYFTVEIPDLQLKLTYNFSFMGFDCPTSGYVFGDVISVDEYEDILENPCCACYADGTGGRKRIVLGKECNQTSNPC